MKKLENKTTQISKGGEEKATYADLIKMVCANPKPGGFDINDIRLRTEIQKVCDKANGTIELENATTDYLKAITATSKWQILNDEIVQFADDIKNGWENISK